ncbi:MAG: HIT family protein [Spongiibacter sp.]|nr:HIT family protein [Spongiibacter sp.]
MTDCIFCQIIAGNAPAHEIYRDDELICFLDVAPATPGHCLIVPLRHHDDIFSMSEEEVAQIGRFARRFAPVLKQVCAADGIGVHQLNGAASGQTVFHYHCHLIPGYTGQTPRIHGREPASAEQLGELAGRLRRAFAGE